ncbi:pyruvate/ketoisovalerate oxidoreductase, gamma subunit [Desulfonatronospira thiodismutans ASO3-1]|uniref:Pyruvate/ketoisovalerate oxidoreductase, gamma subunit n=1 Tax=Desulfonatronospira thiodismutans ASO3-1 TaxID=555779 RepID=D6SRN6_9BACT|nr:MULTISPECIES: pyruvate ferredoxin oxidoreductase subunit gamma [Desulfonatronospira]EFI33352.1 pyruvate/ketoisovalerate oxidoreductase, gamma subunit [Desulfonatronospira thiodismutans ASO3-1]RQD75876.1 MAG: pyruvate ferredoxin oxidoreductase subunit gamma [Desulfonatronospira sp. MSAO_Bac3]
MWEIRLHGRGGQGAVTSAELLARAAISREKFAQAFPSFGPERRGAPVQAFVRVDDKKIRKREKIYQPDMVLVLDPSLLDVVNVAEGLKEDGIVVVNSPQDSAELKQKHNWPGAYTVDATKIAMDILSVPITNTTMLGALLKASGILEPQDMEEVIMDRFGPKLGPKNFEALKKAYELAN